MQKISLNTLGESQLFPVISKCYRAEWLRVSAASYCLLIDKIYPHLGRSFFANSEH